MQLTEKQKKLIFAVTLGLIAAILVVLFSNKDNQSQSSSQTEYESRFDLTIESPKEEEAAIEEKQKIQAQLPIYIEDFQTSVTAKTTINVFALSYDPEHVVRLEIYGIDYNNSQAAINNPEYLAFQDSFEKAIFEITKLGTNPENLIFKLSNTPYIHQVASRWIATFAPNIQTE